MKKKIFLHFILFLFVFFSDKHLLFAQNHFFEDKTWQNMDLEKDNIFGVSANKSYQGILSGKKSGDLIIAVIDGGVDINHEDLKSNIWTNALEIPDNGKDDDGNGYIDDVHGWNFLGSSKSSFLYDNIEILRQLRKELNRDAKSKQSKELLKEVNGRRFKLEKALFSLKFQLDIMLSITKAMGKDIPTQIDFRSFQYKNYTQEKALVYIVNSMKNGNKYDQIREDLESKYKRYKYQLDYFLNLDYDPRKGKEFKQRFHGNPDVKGPESYHGTHVAGIIGALRNNSLGGDGIANNVKIMVLRAIPTGEYLDQDLSDAIRYAVNNGAKIINMSLTKASCMDQALVDDAVRYAMKNDVLIIHSCGNDGKKLDETVYPKREFLDGELAKAWIEVGASNSKNDKTLLSPFSNYSEKVVDVFAPGEMIYSTVPENQYAYLSGTSMAAPVVTGIAAVIRGYYPSLSAIQTKAIIMNSVTKVNQMVETKNGELIPFSDTCISGGIVNLDKALKLAEQMQ